MKDLKGKKIKYIDYDGKIISGKIDYIAFCNKDKSIVWVLANFGYKAFMIPIKECIFEESEQLTLF